MYGPFTNEELLGRAIAGSPIQRDEITVETKSGIHFAPTDGDLAHRVFDGSPENVRSSIDPRGRRDAPDRIGIVPYSPLGRGFLSGRFTSPDDLDSDDFRRHGPGFCGDNLEQNLRLAAKVKEIADEKSCTPA